MALLFIGANNVPAYIALSTDISGSKIDGAVQKGKTVYTTDDAKWYIIDNGLVLRDYVIPASQS